MGDDFPCGQGSALHRLRAELGCMNVFGSAFRRSELGRLTRYFGQPRCVVERVQCARNPPLLVIGFWRATHIRHEFQRLLQRLRGLRHRCGAFLKLYTSAVRCSRQSRVY